MPAPIEAARSRSVIPIPPGRTTWSRPSILNQVPKPAEDGFMIRAAPNLHYALPNFYFHTTTAYDILRSLGVELGKRDFMGQMPS